MDIRYKKKNLTMIDSVSDHGLVVLSIPLDRGLFKLLKSAYKMVACTKWMKLDDSSLKLMERQSQLTMLPNGFRATGAWPIDPGIIQEHEYAGKPDQDTRGEHVPQDQTETQCLTIHFLRALS